MVIRVCVNDKFSQPFKPYLGKDVVYHFYDFMKEQRTCDDYKIWWSFWELAKCWICVNIYIDAGVKVRDH